MKLSAPVYFLKRKAKSIARSQGIPLNKALDTVAAEEGYSNWSLLAGTLSSSNPALKLLSLLEPGDLVLVGARPGHGKTLLCLELIVRAIQSGESGYFFTLDWNIADILKRLADIGSDFQSLENRFNFDNSDDINAAYIIERLERAGHGTFVAIDYLQLLDQRRSNPDLNTQIEMLNTFAKKRKLVIVFVSQIDRAFELSSKQCPELEDIRKINPLNLNLFNKTCFINNGEIHISNVAQ